MHCLIGKSDDEFFDSIRENQFLICRDVILGLFYYSQIIKIN